MRNLQIVARIGNRNAEEVYTILCDFARYPEFSEAVRSVSIDVSEGKTISSWETNFRNGVLAWTEIDYFDPVAGTISFEQIEGDTAHFSGQWTAESVDEGALIYFRAQFDMGMPSLSKILDPIAEQALRENIIAIIRGLFGLQVEILDDATSLPEMQHVQAAGIYPLQI